jgi:lysophospholipid hydrolase
VLYIDSALDWVQIDAGHPLWNPGDVSDSLYIVINGRLRAMRTQEGKQSVIGEYGQGDTVGELDVITHTRRSSTVHAIRDTELVRIPLTLFNAISRCVRGLAHLIISYLDFQEPASDRTVCHPIVPPC